jgi:uncharacterized protein YdaU (DUF1376 family)
MNTKRQISTSISKWMPVWIGDLRRETNGYPLEFEAMYLNLMMAAWERGGQLPDDEKQLCRISGATPSQWLEHRQDLANLFVPRHGTWSHNLIRDELVKAENISARRKLAGQKGNDKRWGRTESKAATDKLLNKITSDVVPY